MITNKLKKVNNGFCKEKTLFFDNKMRQKTCLLNIMKGMIEIGLLSW